MKTYIVVTEVYGLLGSEEIKLSLVKAKDLNALARKLEPDFFDDEDQAVAEGAEKQSDWDRLNDAMGDGMNNYIVKELRGGELIIT